MMVGLDTPLPRVIGKGASLLEKHLDLRTVGDLLTHYPRRWAKRGDLTPLRELRRGEFVTIYARIESAKSRQIRPKLKKTDVVVTDGVSKLTLTFFNLRQFQLTQFTPGRSAFFAGKVDIFNSRLTFNHPEYEFIDEFEGIDTGFASAIVPIYPATKYTSTMAIRRSVANALAVVELPEDPLPADVRDRHDFISYADALEGIHRPTSFEHLAAAKRRLAFDEAFVLQVLMAQRRAITAGVPATARRPVKGGLLEEFDARLPFELTAGQREVGEIIAGEIALDHPMHRLLQGEVGSGKTLVALRAMLAVVDSGGQAALLAPTEVLAQQHYRSISQMLGPLAMRDQLGGAENATTVTLLTGSMGQAARRSAMLDMVIGDAGIVIGTHALLQEKVQFADLGLVVVDEQHRFGVQQRDALRAKAGDDRRPHVLVMTATPIPRTIAMTVYGDLEVSTLRELPKGRAPIASHVVPLADKPNWRRRLWERVREEVGEGRQVYVVCPRIGGDDAAQPDDLEPLADDDIEEKRPPLAVLDVAPRLAENELKGLRIEVLHGRLPVDDKDSVMRAFVAGKVDVLIATTVIEVGVDVPNASTMVILDADRFGLSQLHQLRGRVGRGSTSSICFFVTEAEQGTPARERIEALAKTSDGFALSELDLEQRREGTILGEQQHGRSDLKLLSLVRDRDLIEIARAEATTLVDADPILAGHESLAREVARLLAREGAEFLDKA